MEKVICALAVLLGACGIEPLTSEDIFGLSPDPKVWLTGLVTNARTGAPLADVSIQVDGLATRSDRYGAFRLDGLDVVETTGTASVHGFHSYQLALNLRPGANARDIALEPRECGRFTCNAGEFCDPSRQQCVQGGVLTGAVVSICDGAALDARVTIGGFSTCSTALSGKAHFELRNLPPGGPQTLSVGKVGYQAFSTQLHIVNGFNAADMVRLEPIGGCMASRPTNVPCSCTETN
jgi:hypothetical protein